MVRKRAAVRQMRGWGDDTGLLLTGVSALRDQQIAALFGLSPVDRGTDGYVRAGNFDKVTKQLGLLSEITGNVRVRIVPDEAGYRVDHLLTAAVALDLLESLDTRESAAGLRVLQHLLDDFRRGDGTLNR